MTGEDFILDFSEPLKGFFKRCLTKEPENRFIFASEMKEALSCLIKGPL
jgi:hypothetical protein